MKRFLSKNLKFFKYSVFLSSKLRLLKSKKWESYIRFNFRNYLPRTKFFRHDVIKKRSNVNVLRNETKQLMLAKQWLKNYYGGIKNKEFRNWFVNNSCFLLTSESRLDINIFRSNLVSNISTIRQLISHNKVYVNNIVVSKASFRLKQGDVVKISSEKALKHKMCQIKFFTLNRLEVSHKLSLFIVSLTSSHDLKGLVAFTLKEQDFGLVYRYFVVQKRK